MQEPVQEPVQGRAQILQRVHTQLNAVLSARIFLAAMLTQASSLQSPYPAPTACTSLHSLMRSSVHAPACCLQPT